MDLTSFILLCTVYNYLCEAGVTDIPPVSSEVETVVETVSDDTWMPANIFDARPSTNEVQKERENAIENLMTTTETTWDADTSPIFKAIRDFIFQASDGIVETEEHNEDPTEEIVKIIEKGLIEATTMFLTPSDSEQLAATSDNPVSDSISVLKIENEAPDTMLDRIGLNPFDFPSTSNRQSLSITNTTVACSTCYNALDMCVQRCFISHNCNNVQRQARVCPPPSARICNFFTQWSPVDECKVHEDCKSPLLCCSDGCVNTCSPGVWRN